MGGNAVTQTLGVVIRALALNHMHDWDLWKIALRQTWVGAFNGFVNGLAIAALTFAWTRSFAIPMVLIAAMVINLLVAGAGGVLIPVAMKRLRIDPALASTVFATTLTDCVGFFAFLGLAKILLT
jgi:magnesium transporter